MSKKQQWVIVADSVLKEGELMFLVNRHITKNIWWTQDDNIILKISDKKKALKIIKNFKYNNPRLMPLNEAEEYLKNLYEERVLEKLL